MPSKSKRKGNNFERTVVNQAKAVGVPARRAWGSDGRSLGLPENVDVEIGSYRGQCKIRKKLGALYRVEPNCDIQIFKEDRGETYVMLTYTKFLELINGKKTKE